MLFIMVLWHCYIFAMKNRASRIMSRSNSFQINICSHVFLEEQILKLNELLHSMVLDTSLGGTRAVQSVPTKHRLYKGFSTILWSLFLDRKRSNPVSVLRIVTILSGFHHFWLREKFWGNRFKKKSNASLVSSLGEMRSRNAGFHCKYIVNTLQENDLVSLMHCT